LILLIIAYPSFPVKEETMQLRHQVISNYKFWMLWGVLILFGLTLVGCAGSSGPQSPQVAAPQTAEQLLSAAGFKQIFPTTPAQQARVQNMPQKQIFMISKGPKVYYVYADANGCGCLYVGNQQKYQNFQRLLTQSQLAAEQYQAAQMNTWDWGPWASGWGMGEAGTWD
jgi:hypothetical protein